MKQVLIGAVFCSVLLIPKIQAVAQSPTDADMWVGFENTGSGFLLDTNSGATWLTGNCLKPIAKAERMGSVWISETHELVSVGRMETLLQQTFRIDISESSPSISVENPSRGGAQTFDDVQMIPCSDGSCQDLSATPAC